MASRYTLPKDTVTTEILEEGAELETLAVLQFSPKDNCRVEVVHVVPEGLEIFPEQAGWRFDRFHGCTFAHEPSDVIWRIGCSKSQGLGEERSGVIGVYDKSNARQQTEMIEHARLALKG